MLLWIRISRTFFQASWRIRWRMVAAWTACFFCCWSPKRSRRGASCRRGAPVFYHIVFDAERFGIMKERHLAHHANYDEIRNKGNKNCQGGEKEQRCLNLGVSAIGLCYKGGGGWIPGRREVQCQQDLVHKGGGGVRWCLRFISKKANKLSCMTGRSIASAVPAFYTAYPKHCTQTVPRWATLDFTSTAPKAPPNLTAWWSRYIVIFRFQFSQELTACMCHVRPQQTILFGILERALVQGKRK